LRSGREGTEKHAGVFHRVGLSLRGMGSGSPLEGLPYGDTHFLYPSQTFPVRLPRMKNLTATICLTIAVLLGSVGVSWSADFQKGVTAAQSVDFATDLRRTLAP
jgi:hypothetical protein